jgi:tetratricopeptide (TPR) repeat protein
MDAVPTGWKRPFVALPDPKRAGTLDEAAEALRLLKAWAGDPSYDTIKDRVNAAWRAGGRPGGELTGKSTVADCFRPGRRRLNHDLVIAVIRALCPDEGYAAQWRQALRVIGGRGEAATQIRVRDRLPPALTGFTGRTAELAMLRQALRQGETVVVSGMAGAGKTQLAVHAGHLLDRDQPVDRTLFVDLRGFHPDPAQPPADPAAVLEGFLRLLGVPGQQIPHDLAARTAAYRRRLAGTRTLVVLDNAADTDQVRHLLPMAGCPVVITSRRDLKALHPATHVTLDVFTPTESVALLATASAGDDPDALARIADRCGRLPLALGIVAAHLRRTPGWTLTDHADRLDERHRDRRLDPGVQLAFDLSYQHLSAGRQRLLRLVALHPGQEFDAHAAAALAGSGLAAARIGLRQLCRDHLLQETAPGRYTMHDLVRSYAIVRGDDEDSPSGRRAARTRLFDYYLAAAATAMNSLHPYETRRRTDVPSTACVPVLADEGTARDWLDNERPALVTVAGYTAAHGWPAHTVELSATLYRYLVGGHLSDALTVHGHAVHTARHLGDLAGQAGALNNLGVAHLRLGRYQPAAEHIQQALDLFRQLGDRAGEAGALNNLAEVEVRLGRYDTAADRLDQTLALVRQLGHRANEANALDSSGTLHTRRGQPERAAAHYRQALAIFREIGDRDGEASALNGLGDAAQTAGRPTVALVNYAAARSVAAGLGDRYRLARAHTGLGRAHHTLGQRASAGRHYRHALTLYTGLSMPDADRVTALLAAVDDAPTSRG